MINQDLHLLGYIFLPGAGVLMLCSLMSFIVYMTGGGMRNIFGPIYPWGRWNLGVMNKKRLAALKNKQEIKKIHQNALIYGIISAILALFLIYISIF